MYLSNIKLWNFRKFGAEGEINLEKPNLNLTLTKGLNVIIGENDSGKTAIIDALKLVLKTHSYDYIRVEDKDFYKLANRFRIELTFEGLTSDEAKNFTEWLGWTGTGEETKPLLKINYDVKRQDKKILPTDVKAGFDDDGYLLTAEAKEYLKTTYLKPLRDAENELIAKRNSRLSQILLGDTAFKGKEKEHELVKIFESLSKELKKYFEGEFEIKTKNEAGEEQTSKPQEGKQIKDKIDGYIKGFYGDNYETEFTASSNDIKSILEKLTLFLKDEPNPGLGTLNRLFMAAELLHLNKLNWSGLRLGLVEELEAHLHPQAQMQVIEAFQKQDNIQLILTTHSPNLASKVKLENLIICNNKWAFPMGSEHTKLKKTDYPFFERFLDVTKSNLFFANGIVLVEGVAEELIIPSLAKLLFKIGEIDNFLINKKVSVVSIGNTSFNRYSKIFLRNKNPHFNIPISVVNDLDLRPIEYASKYGYKTTKAKKKHFIITEFDVDAFKLQKSKEYGNQGVNLFLSNHWTLEYCIALHPKLNRILFASIIQSLEEIRADNYSGVKANKRDVRLISDDTISVLWEAFIKEKNAEQIAFDIMNEYIIDGKKVSKAIIAMHFACKLELSDITKEELLINNNPIQYLINAIRYATGN